MKETILHEDFLHFIWKNKLFTPHQISTDGVPIEILSTGFHNHSSGPDFTNARIRKEHVEWNGHVEIHIKSSDWDAHQHSQDPAYNSVVLHVVKEHDKPIFDQAGNKLLCIELAYPSAYEANYKNLLKQDKSLNCESQLNQIHPRWFKLFLGRLAVERLERKSKQVLKLVASFQGDWLAVFYVLLCQYVSGNYNAPAYEQLFRSLGVKILQQNSDRLQILEALLYGQAGMLEAQLPEDAYFTELQTEYRYQQHKYKLSPLPAQIWKYMRIMPNSFPSIRLSQLAQIFHLQVFSPGYFVDHCPNINQLNELPKIAASPYWDTHFRFGKLSPKKSRKYLGTFNRNLLLINAVVPYVFAYAQHTENLALQNYAIQLLTEIKAEQNKYTKRWKKLGFQMMHAQDSQALVQLSTAYCEKNRCLHCAIGTKICASHSS